MSPLRIALAFGCAALAAAPVARGDASTDDNTHLHLYHDARLGPVSQEARKAVAQIALACSYSPLSRIGPSPRERQLCDKATTQASALGADAARASLQALERADTPTGARYRLYDVVAQSGDPALAEPLATAIDRVKTQAFLFDESFAIEHTLQKITYASVGDRAPWVPLQPDGAQRDRAEAWRRFVAQHRGQSREQLRAERLADARAHKSDGDAARAYFAASFLAAQPDARDEGRAALTALLGRGDLPRGAQSSVRSVLESLAAPAAPARSRS
jgi:hypothetical protein